MRAAALLLGVWMVLGGCGDDGQEGPKISTNEWEGLRPCDPGDSNALGGCISECLSLPSIEWPADNSIVEGYFCTSKCQDDTDCAGYGTDAICGDSGACTLACDNQSWSSVVQYRSRLCIDGKGVFCDDLGGTHCGECGCRELYHYCDSATDTCTPQRTVGEACSAPEQCLTNECSASMTNPQQTVCQSRLGDICTDASCAFCETDGTNSFCTGDCSASDAPLTVQNGEVTLRCFVDTTTRQSSYKVMCKDGACPLSTQQCFQSGDGYRFCDVPTE